MTYGLNIIEREFKPIRFSLKLNLFDFISKHLEKWMIGKLEEIDIKLEGLTSLYSKSKVVYWEDDYIIHDELVKMFRLILQSSHNTPFKAKLIIGSIISNLEVMREVVINGESLSETDYLNLNDANRQFIEKQLIEEADIEVHLD